MTKRLGSQALKSPKHEHQTNEYGDEEEVDANTRGAHLKLAQRHRKIAAGRFKGMRSVEPEEAAPGVLGQLAICFTTNGALLQESRVTCELPDRGWSMLSSQLNALLRLPQGCPVPSLKASWTPATRTFEFTLLSEGIASDTPVAIIVSGVHTPEAATPQGEGVVTAFEKLVVRNTAPASTRGGQIIDGPCRFVIHKILPGQVTGPRRWLPFSCCPGAVSDVSLSFQVNGAIPVGGKILIELPADGWDMDDRPKVLLRNANYHNSVMPAVWTRSQHALEITVGVAMIPMKSSVTITVARVQNPPKETLISGGASVNARITTLSAAGGVIDGPSKLDVARTSELREADFEVARLAFDSESRGGGKKSGCIAIEKVADVLKRIRVCLPDELYQSLVVANLPIRAAPASSAAQDGGSSEEPASTTTTAPPVGDGTSQQPTVVEPGFITRDEFLNLFAGVYAPAYKFGQELRVACGRGQVDKAREWVARGCDPNATDASGWSAVHYAADYGRLEVLETLLELDGQPADGRGATTDGAAASAANLTTEESRRLNLKLDARDGHGWTPLMCAAANGHTRVVETLLANGADASIANAEGRTALHWASARGMDETLHVLLHVTKDAPPIDAVDRSGWSALHCAMLHGSPQCAKLLVESGGASAALKDHLQYAPAHYGRADA
ncbi:hypothetical protein Gpo141_00013283 [Globisporangium polare]